MVLLPATISARLPRLAFLGKYREPGLLLAAGFLVGLLLFLSWLALQPGTDKALSGAQSAATGAAAQKPATGAEGVLGDITGGLDAGKPGRQAQSVGGGASAPSLDGQEDAEPAFAGSDGNPDLPGNDGQAPAGGWLDESSAAPEASPDGAMQLWYVEVMREPGMSEYLQINAESAEHARAIIRDYRGDPQIIRGPSPRPLD